MNHVILNALQRILLSAAILSVSLTSYAFEPAMTMVPEPGVVSQLSEFELHFNGDWARGSKPSAKIIFDGPVGQRTMLNSSTGTYVFISFPDDEVITTPGEYTLTIPAHKYQIDGKDNEETVFSYTIIEGGDVKVFPGYTLDPTPGPVASITHPIRIQFDQVAEELTVDKTAISLYGHEEPISLSISTNTEEGYIDIQPLNDNGQPTPIFDPGEYTLIVAKRAIKFDGIPNDTEITALYSVLGGEYQPWGGMVKANPEDGSHLEGLKTIEVTFEGAALVSVVDNATPSMFPTLYVAESMTRICRGTVFAAANILDINLDKNVTDGGTYQLVIPASLIRVNGLHPESDITLTYHINVEVPRFEYAYTLVPTAGDKIGEDTAITITFDGEDLKEVVNDAYSWGDSAPHFTNDFGGYNPPLSISQDGASFLFTPQWPFETNGQYTLVIPAGYFTLYNTSGESVKNDLITATYEVELTGLSDVTAEYTSDADTDVYTITGIRVIRDAKASDIQALPAGVYIIGSKKHFVR